MRKIGVKVGIKMRKKVGKSGVKVEKPKLQFGHVMMPDLRSTISDNFNFHVFSDFFSVWLLDLKPATSQISDHQELKKLARQL